MADAVWVLINVATSEEFKVIPYDASSTGANIKCELQYLNKAQVICAATGPIEVDTEVKVVERTGSGDRVMFHGYVKKYTQMGTGSSSKNLYKYNITEVAVELQDYRVNSGGSCIVNFAGGSLESCVGTILAGSGWTVTGTPPSSNTISPVQFYHMTALSALQHTVVEMGAPTGTTHYWLWFETTPGSSIKQIGWGTQRNDRTAVNFTLGRYYAYEDYKDNIKKGVDGVTVLGQGAAYSGTYPAAPAGYKIAVYQYDAAVSNEACAQLAQRIYSDYLKDPERRIQFKIRPSQMNVGGNYIQEGDVIQVDGNNYVITDLYITPSDVQVGVNAGEASIIALLGDRLRPISGSAISQTDQSWDPGTQNVSSDNVTLTNYTLNIKDVGYLGPSVSMHVDLGAYRAYSYQAATSVSNAVLSDVTIPSTYNATSASIASTPGSTVYVPMWGASCYVTSATVNDGFQYALASVSLEFLNVMTDLAPCDMYVVCNYSYDGVTWYEGTHQTKVQVLSVYEVNTIDPVGTAVIPFRARINCMYIVPGVTYSTQLYVRWKIINDGTYIDAATCIWVEEISVQLDILPRHTHTFNQVGQSDNTVFANQMDDLKETTAPTPADITCVINGSAPMVLADGSTTDIKSYLVSGINTISFRSDEVCTVTPSATYRMFGV